MLKKIKKIFAIGSLVWFFSGFLQAQPIDIKPTIEMGFRHILMLQPGIDQVVGSYMFGVHNRSSEATIGKVPVMLPKETIDFGPQGGVQPNELKLGENGTLYLEKTFKPGLNLVGVGFFAKAEDGNAQLTMESLSNIQELNLVTRDVTIKIDSKGMKPGLSPMLANSGMNGLINENPIPVGEKILVSVSGLPLGRGSFWILGWNLLAVLCLLAIFGVLKTKSETHAQTSNDIMAGNV